MLHRFARRGALFVALSVIATMVVGLPAAAARPAPEVDPRFAADLSRLDDGDTYGAFVHFRDGSGRTQSAFLRERGLDPIRSYSSVGVVFAVGPVASFHSLLTQPSVSYLEADRPLTFHDESAPWATRVRVAQKAVAGGPYLAADGSLLDGSGVGVAVVDSGVNALHRDLDDRVVRNYKIVCSTPGLISTRTEQCFGPMAFVDTKMTDTSSGHGTHVAGIVAGTGEESQGTFTGVAPGSSIFGYSTGEGIRVLYATEAFQHILDNYDSFNPKIRVINNSWGDSAGSTYDGKSVLNLLTQRLVAKGVTMVFSAGNNGGDGSADRTSSYCKDPTPGVICVANYNDAIWGDEPNDNPNATDQYGTRDGSLNSSSSRGLRTNASTYPDISAPGTWITAACVRESQPVCNAGQIAEARWAPWYGTISGTSMAAPHVAGVAALAYQVDPSLTPAAVEDLLQDTSYKFTFGEAYVADPQNAGGTTSVDKGAGLADAVGLLDALRVQGKHTASPARLIQEDEGDFAGPGAADIAGLTVSEESAGIRYSVEVRDAKDVAPGLRLRVTQIVGGVNRLTNVDVSATAATPVTERGTSNTAPATEAAVVGNVISFLVPFANLGNPGPNTAAHNVFVSAFISGIVDVAPGGPGADVLLRPRYGHPYTIHPQAPDPSQPTTLEFTSAPTGQYSDSATAEVRLSADEAPVAHAAVDFTFQGETVTVTTDEAGLARASLELTAAPGEYLIDASFAGVTREFAASNATSTLTIDKEETQLVAAPDSQSRGQYSDAAALSVILSDDDGTPLQAQPVTISLDQQRSTAESGTDGRSVATFDLTDRPGTYSTGASFSGNDFYDAADWAGSFTIGREVTVLTLDVSGRGSNKTLTATLLDDDGAPVAGRTVRFYADGQLMPNGTEVTNADGSAVYRPTGRWASGNRSYSASFVGDAYYEPSGSAPAGAS